MRGKPRIQTLICLTPVSKELGSRWGQLLAPLILTAVMEHQLWARCSQVLFHGGLLYQTSSRSSHLSPWKDGEGDFSAKA